MKGVVSVKTEIGMDDIARVTLVLLAGSVNRHEEGVVYDPEVPE